MPTQLQLLNLLGFDGSSVICMFLYLLCDNISAIALSTNPVFHDKSKHIEIDYHFVRKRVTRGDLQVQHVSSADQSADILTKGLSAPLFQQHCANLMLSALEHQIEGGYKKNEVENSGPSEKDIND
ncbi:hypothetical protein ACFX15_005640 [Malus domestica]